MTGNYCHSIHSNYSHEMHSNYCHGIHNRQLLSVMAIRLNINQRFMVFELYQCFLNCRNMARTKNKVMTQPTPLVRKDAGKRMVAAVILLRT